MRFEFAPGSVVPANGDVYVSPDIASFLTRSTEPRGGQGHLVLGNYKGQLSARGEVIQLLDASDRQVAQLTFSGFPSDAQTNFRITEIHFAPAGGRDDEFIELQNIGAEALDLSGVTFARGIDYSFPDGARVEAGERLLLAADAQAFQSRHPDIDLFGEFEGSLDNAGERITLRDGAGEMILDFAYDDAWFPEAEAEGKSLEILDASDEIERWGIEEAWQVSAAPGGTPGTGPVAAPEAITYAVWAASFFTAGELSDASVSGISADANGDGVQNVVAYAFDFSPKGSDRSNRVLEVSTGRTVTYERWAMATDISYILEGSNDLRQWSPIDATVTTRLDGIKERVQATLPPKHATHFVRLRIVVK